MALVTVFSNANRQAGTYNFSSTPVPVGLNRIDIVALRDNWPDVGGDLIILAVDISFDAGQTWQLLLQFTAQGGVFLGSDGNPITETTASIDLPQPTNQARRIRAVLTCTAQFRTTVTANLITA